MSEPFKLLIQSEADLAGLDAYLKSLAHADAAQVKADGSLQKVSDEAKKTEMTFGQLERELNQARLALSMLTPSDSRLGDLQKHIAGLSGELAKSRGGMQGFRGDIGQSALMMAQFADDAQYGLRGIMNNVPGLVMALGGGAGLAGVLSIGLLAASQLYDKLSSSSEAEQGPKDIKDEVSRMKAALDAAKSAAEEAYQVKLDDYLEGIKASAAAWKEQADEIDRARAAADELARIDASIAGRKMEIAKQEAMAKAGSEEERKAIAADFDAKKATMNDAGRVEASQRALDAVQRLQEMLAVKERDAVQSAQTTAKEQKDNTRASAEFGATTGQLSDQANQVNAHDAAVKQRDAARERIQEIDSGAATAELAKKLNGEDLFDAVAALQTEREALAKSAEEAQKIVSSKREGLDQARKALAEGKGLTFNDLQKQADQTGDPSQERKHAEASQRQSELDERRKTLDKAQAEQEEQLAKLRAARIEAARQAELKAKQLEDARLAAAETRARAKVKDVEQDEARQKKDAEAKKKLADDLAIKAENDALRFEKNGDPMKAAEARNRAAEFRLPQDATAAQRERMKLENDERIAKARGNAKSTAAAEAGSDAAGALRGQGLGAAADSLSRATEKLRDGASASEAAAAAKAVNDLVPMVSQFNAQTRKELSELAAALKSLQAQFKNNPER